MVSATKSDNNQTAQTLEFMQLSANYVQITTLANLRTDFHFAGMDIDTHGILAHWKMKKLHFIFITTINILTTQKVKESFGIAMKSFSCNNPTHTNWIFWKVNGYLDCKPKSISKTPFYLKLSNSQWSTYLYFTIQILLLLYSIVRTALFFLPSFTFFFLNNTHLLLCSTQCCFLFNYVYCKVHVHYVILNFKFT